MAQTQRCGIDTFSQACQLRVRCDADYARADALAWMWQISPQMSQITTEVQKASILRNNTGGIGSKKYESRGVGPSAAATCSIIMEQLLIQNAREADGSFSSDDH